jgi:hypothetical protein
MGEGLIVEFIKFYTSLICLYRELGTGDKNYLICSPWAIDLLKEIGYRE